MLKAVLSNKKKINHFRPAVAEISSIERGMSGGNYSNGGMPVE